MATTTNYGWTTPDDTALVKDGASAIRTLGSSVDTSVKALNPGTTSGDLDYYTAATTKARIAKGTAGQVFTMNAGATAPEWATPASGSTFAGCSVRLGSSLSVANNVDFIVTFNTEDFDTNTYHDTSTNTSRLTIPTGKGGYYIVGANAVFNANATGIRSIKIRKNGSTYIAQNSQSVAGGGDNQGVGLIRTLNLAAADYIEVEVYQNSGAALNLNSTNTGTNFFLSYIGA